MNHAPTPWRVEDNMIKDATGLPVRGIEDLIRAVACVNAFEGIETEAIDDYLNRRDAEVEQRMVKAMDQARAIFNRNQKLQAQPEGARHDTNQPTGD